jgi:hypothetical protein
LTLVNFANPLSGYIFPWNMTKIALPSNITFFWPMLDVCRLIWETSQWHPMILPPGIYFFNFFLWV